MLARVASGPWAGSPVVVQTSHGDGTAYYIGTRLDADGLARVYDLVRPCGKACPTAPTAPTASSGWCAPAARATSTSS